MLRRTLNESLTSPILRKVYRFLKSADEKRFSLYLRNYHTVEIEDSWWREVNPEISKITDDDFVMFDKDDEVGISTLKKM